MRSLRLPPSGVMIPYTACFATTWGLIGLESRVRVGEVAAAFVLQVGVGALLVDAARLDAHRWVRAIAVVAFLASVVLLRDGVGSTPGYAALVLLPIIWAAGRSRRADLIWAIAGGAVVVFAPIVVIGGERYPPSGWPTGSLFILIAAIIGVTVLTFVERLSSSEKRYRLLAANSSDLIIRFAFDGAISYASPASTALLGYEPEELVGQKIFSLMDARDRPDRDGRKRRLAGRVILVVHEARLRHRDGHYVWTEATVRTIREPDGAIHEGQAAIRLIEKRKQLQLAVLRQRDETNEMLAFQDALQQIATLVATGAVPSEIFAASAEQVARLFGATLGRVVRFDGISATGELIGGWSSDHNVITGQTIDLTGASAAARVYQTAAPAQIPAVDDHRTAELTSDSHRGASICSPIFVGGRLWGSAGAVFATGMTVPPGAGERLARFAKLVAVAIANAQTLETLAQLAATDAVTGLANFRTFHELLATESERATRYGRALCVALFDIDHFKDVNDTHGHQAGDIVLAAVANRLAETARTTETLARVGGEEFAWLMPETTLDGAYLAAERARHAIESTPFPAIGRLTVSVGVASNQYAATGQELLHSADQTLYQAKRTGRNLTFIHGQDTPQIRALRGAERTD
jgi:diguanylate cyclase (GGDEF)-like protein/PAS domain S-box-containing protein